MVRISPERLTIVSSYADIASSSSSDIRHREREREKERERGREGGGGQYYIQMGGASQSQVSSFIGIAKTTVIAHARTHTRARTFTHPSPHTPDTLSENVFWPYAVIRLQAFPSAILTLVDRSVADSLVTST